jgi:hypothetical protein
LLDVRLARIPRPAIPDNLRCPEKHVDEHECENERIQFQPLLAPAVIDAWHQKVTPRLCPRSVKCRDLSPRSLEKVLANLDVVDNEIHTNFGRARLTDTEST